MAISKGPTSFGSVSAAKCFCLGVVSPPLKSRLGSMVSLPIRMACLKTWLAVCFARFAVSKKPRFWALCKTANNSGGVISVIALFPIHGNKWFFKRFCVR